MIFNIQIKNVQHVSELTYTIDLSENRIHCIVGKNGVGKTTLIRAIRNIQFTDTYATTASPYIFNEESNVTYQIDNEKYSFIFDAKINSIDTKEIIKEEIKDNIFVELPIPHGERFSYFQTLSNIDETLKQCIILNQYEDPVELIEFLKGIYNSDRFDNLKVFYVKNKPYYFILKDHDYYIREDYFSSGEYFVVSLYKMIQRKRKCITIDEIDISLDAHAQVNLIKQLRIFCEKYNVNIIFTTHSLPLMKTLTYEELFYMDNSQGFVTVENQSYSYIKSLLFGFHGWDRYILTEDVTLQDYIEHTISKDDIRYRYKIIHIGGASQVVDLMNRNSRENFLSLEVNVISVLDGDQNGKGYLRKQNNVFLLPFQSVEKDLYAYYLDNDPGIPRVPDKIKFNGKSPDKTLYNALTHPWEGAMTKEQIFDFLNDKKPKDALKFKTDIVRFLT